MSGIIVVILFLWEPCGCGGETSSAIEVVDSISDISKIIKLTDAFTACSDAYKILTSDLKNTDIYMMSGNDT